MTPDARWLEILKASGWQTAAVAIAYTVFPLPEIAPYFTNSVIQLPSEY